MTTALLRNILPIITKSLQILYSIFSVSFQGSLLGLGQEEYLYL